MELYSYEMHEKRIDRVCMDVGDVLAIDNWRTLHGRGKCSSLGEGRRLLRIFVR